LESKAEVHLSPYGLKVLLRLILILFMYKWVDFAHFFYCSKEHKRQNATLLLIYFWRCFVISSKELMINEEIKDKEVRLIDSDGSQLDVVNIEFAMKKAEERGLDLVKIAPQAKPPVCKIMDYGKYRFEMAKREKEAKKNQKTVSIKEIRVSPSIDVHDFDTKVNHTKKFLSSGDKVKITVRFRGRELHHTQIGNDLLAKFATAVSEVGNVEKAAKLEGRNMSMTVAPK